MIKWAIVKLAKKPSLAAQPCYILLLDQSGIREVY